MNILALGNVGYAITGAVQIEDGYLLSNTNFGQRELTAAAMALLRLSTDEKPLYLPALSGKLYNMHTGELLPINDDKAYGEYNKYTITGINILEMQVNDVTALINNFMSVSEVLEKINLYNHQLSTGDITKTKIDKIIAHFDTILDGLAITLSGSLTTGGKSPITISASGLAVPNSLSCTYNMFMDSWSVKFKVMKKI